MRTDYDDAASSRNFGVQPIIGYITSHNGTTLAKFALFARLSAVAVEVDLAFKGSVVA